MDRDVTAPAAREWAGLLIVVLIAGVDFGLNYGVSNQNTYLIAGLQKLHPGLLSQDWLSHTYQIHHLFTDLVPVLARLGPLPWVLAALNVLMIAGTLLAWRTVFRVLEPRTATAATLLLTTAFVAGGTFSVGGTYLFSSYLQPSSIAAFGMLLAVVSFLHGRYLVSGVLLALGVAFHANYLVLGVLLFGLAHLALGPRDLVRRGMMQLLPSALVFLRELPVFLAVANAPQSQRSLYIFTRIRAPHHFYPPAFLPDYLVYAGWLLLAFAASVPSASEAPPLVSRLRALQRICIGLIVSSTLLTTVLFIPKVALLYLWRLAPFSVLAAQVLVIRAVLAKLTGSPAELAVPWAPWRRGVWMAGILLPLLRAIRFPGEPGTFLILPLGLLLGTFAYAWWTRRGAVDPSPSRQPAGTLAAALCVVTLATFLVSSLRHSTLLHGVGGPNEQQLYAWARTTDSNAMFLVPPGMGDFRLQSERAVVVDWKSSAVLADDAMEWYRRIGRISRDSMVGGLLQAEQGYSQLDTAALDSLRQEFGAVYAVFRVPHPVTDGVAYQNAGFVVLSLH